MSEPSPPDPAPLVGRDAELARLDALLAEALSPSGRARAALITGPSGIGKTALLSALRRKLRAQRQPVLEGWCRPTDHRPHGPLLDLLGATAQRLAEAGRPGAATERALACIAGLDPDHTTRREDQQLAFHETVRQALVEAAAELPPVIILHDLHRADPTTLSLIRYLLDNLLTDPVFEWGAETRVETAGAVAGGGLFRGLLVLSFRVDAATRPLLELARGSVNLDHLPLAPLDAAGVEAWLTRPAVVARLLEASGGLPAALEHLIDALPADPKAAWAARFDGLSPHAEAVLDALTVFERPATLSQLQALLTLAGPVPETLADLTRRGLVERTLDRGRFAFRVPGAAAREAYLARLPPDRRARTHRRIAGLLAQAGDLGAEPAEIAHHLLLGDATEEAIPYAITAAARFEAGFAFMRAARLLEAVAPALPAAQRRPVLARLADLYEGAGDLQQARALLGQLVEPAAPEAALVERLARAHLRAGEAEPARALTAAALAAAPDPAARAALLAVAAEAAYALGDLGAADARAAEALAAPAAPIPATLSARNTRGKILLVREALDEAEAHFAANLEAAAGAGLLDHQARALINLGVVDLQRGAAQAARARFEAARDLCERTGDVRHLALAVENLAVLHHRRQAFGEALSHYHRSSAVARQLGQRGQLATTALNLADLYLTVGDAERARRLADIAGEIVEAGAHRYLETQRHTLEASLARAEGDLGRAAAELGAALDRLERGDGNNQRQGPVLCALAEIRIEQGLLEDATALLDRAAALPAAQSDAYTARLQAARGALDLARGAPEDARAHLESAAALADQAGDLETLARALALQADGHWSAGRRSETLQTLAAAVEVTERAAAALPEPLEAIYRASPPRRGLRDALRRVRAGIAPRGRLAEDADLRARRDSAWRPQWATRYPDIIGRAPALLPVFNALDRVAGSAAIVLIRGESGTGKELVAAALHDHSPRRAGPFVRVNCAAFVETLLLSELFGHERGAFTGAASTKKGRFELADGGTLFLDEIGDISPNTQVALLRVLQEGTFERVGGQQTLQVDVRVICATHRNLEEMVRLGSFRADLYYRLRGIILEVPALRDRRADIPLLVDHFLARRPHADQRPLSFSRAALASLLQHDWPGNVRELENVVRSVALFADGATIGLSELSELGDIFRAPDEQALLDLSDLVESGIIAPADSAPPAAAEAPRPEAEPEAPRARDPAGPDPAGPDPALPRPGEGTDPPPSADGAPGPALDEAWFDVMLERAGSLSNLKRLIERKAIAQAIIAAEGNITRAADALGMKRPRLSQIINGDDALGELRRRVEGK